MSNPDVLTNDNFKILSWLYDNQDKDHIVKVTQAELAEIMNLSRPTINTIFTKLKESGYLIHDSTKIGRYFLTEDAISIIQVFRNEENR